MLMLLTACYTPRETTHVSNIDNSPSENPQIEKGKKTEEKSLDNPRNTTNLTNGDNNDRSTKSANNEQKDLSEQDNVSPKIARFFCGKSYDQQSDRYLFTTFARTTTGQKAKVIVWETEFFTGSGYNPKTRCEEVSPRFDKAYKNGSINVMTNGRMNNQPVICTAQSPDGTAKTATGRCQTLLITMRSNKESLANLKYLEDLFSGRQSGPMRHNSGNGQRQIFIEIDIDNFLENATVR